MIAHTFNPDEILASIMYSEDPYQVQDCSDLPDPEASEALTESDAA